MRVGFFGGGPAEGGRGHRNNPTVLGGFERVKNFFISKKVDMSGKMGYRPAADFVYVVAGRRGADFLHAMRTGWKWARHSGLIIEGSVGPGKREANGPLWRTVTGGCGVAPFFLRKSSVSQGNCEQQKGFNVGGYRRHLS